ncbi:MAG: hypothetical protein WAV41_05020 [Microgenomates group bacterium]
MDSCGIFEKFDLQNNLVKEYQYWYILIRTRQSYLGNCVAILKRHVFPISQLTQEESEEYSNLVKEVEISLIKSFNCEFVQTATIMYIDKHVHTFIFPRYQGNIEFNNKTWVDDKIPDPLINKSPDCTPADIVLIKNKILENLK